MVFQFDIPQLVLHFGGPTKIADGLAEHALPPLNSIAVIRWIERNSIPPGRLIDLMILAERQGARLELYDFLTPAPVVAREEADNDA